MKIAVATMNGGLEDSVSPIFGRCMNYTIVECEKKEIKDTDVVDNPGASAMGGAGTQAAQFISNQEAEAIIAGNFGPNAAAVLDQAKVKMIQAQGNVKEIVLKYLKGELKPITGPTVDPNFGKGRGFGGGQRKGGVGRGRRGGV